MSITEKRTEPSKRIVRVAPYIRISRDDAELKGLGVERQLAIIRAALPRFGTAGEEWVETIVLDENNTSATDGKMRPALTRGLDMIRNGELDAIACYSQDRLLRMPTELEHIIHMHEYVTPVRLATSASGEINLSDPDAVHSARVNAAGSARESALISKRRRDEVQQFAERGQRHGAAPFGWKRERTFSPQGRQIGSRDVIDPDEAGVLRYAARRILSGVSVRAVTAELATGEVHPRIRVAKKTGKPSSGAWSTSQLRTYLLRESNIGLRVHHGSVMVGVAGDWEPIFTQSEFIRIKAMLNDPARRSNTHGSVPRHMLSGLAQCAQCGAGSKIRARKANSRGSLVYMCVGTEINPGCWQAHRVADIDPFIDGAVERILADPSMAEPDDDADAELAPLYARLDELTAEELEWVNTPGIKPHQVVAANVRIDAERDAIKAQIDALMPTLNATIDLPAGWTGADIATRKAMLTNLFESITLNPPAERGYGRKFHPADITVIPRKRAHR